MHSYYCRHNHKQGVDKMDTNCPKCFKSLQASPAHLSYVTLCPHCGWKKQNQSMPLNSHTQSKKKLQRSISKTMILTAIGLIALLIHFSKWGGHSLEIVYLKVSQWTRLAGDHQYEKLSSICAKIKNYDCLAGSLKSHYTSSKNSEILKELALLYFKTGEKSLALQAYKKYFKEYDDNVSIDPQSAFNFAKLLSEQKNKENALYFYDQILQNQAENMIPINVVRNKVLLLSSMNRTQEAQQLIQKYISKLTPADVILKQELESLTTKIMNNS